MPETPRHHDPLTSIAKTVPSSDQRSDQPGSVPDAEPDPNDTTSILQGSRAFFGKDALSAGRMATVEGPIAQYMRVQQAINLKAEQARQLARLAEWNAARTVVGGVAMTNKEAQVARQHVVDYGDQYAEWAVQRGLIGAADKDEFKRVAQRRMELEDKRGRGTITADEDREAREIERSRVGRAVDAATAQDHLQRLRGLDASTQRNDANATLRTEGKVVASGDQTPFQALQAAQNPVGGPAPAVDKRVLATGLDL